MSNEEKNKEKEETEEYPQLVISHSGEYKIYSKEGTILQFDNDNYLQEFLKKKPKLKLRTPIWHTNSEFY